MREVVEWDRPPELEGVLTLRIRGSSRMWKMVHHAYMVCNPLPSPVPAVEWLYRGQLNDARPGVSMLVEPGETHVNTRLLGVRDGDESRSSEAVGIDPHVVERFARELGVSTPHFRLAQIEDGAVHDAVARLLASTREGATRLEMECRLSHLLRVLVATHVEQPALVEARWEKPAVRRACDVLRERAAENVSLDELARVARLSRFHFIRAFTRTMGMPPHEYQLCVRVARAREMLARGQPPVDVAADLGFADQSHFGRHFRRQLGVSPGVYAASVKGRR
jgi:AraC-like DNA-binding protein